MPVYYTTTTNAVYLNIPFNVSDEAIVAVTVAYESRAIEVITYQTTYPIVQLFSDFSSMIGTILGLGALKFFYSVPLIILAFRKRSMIPIEHMCTRHCEG